MDYVERHEVDAHPDGDLHDQTELVDCKPHWTEPESDARAQQVSALQVLELVLDLKEREPAVSCRGQESPEGRGASQGAASARLAQGVLGPRGLLLELSPQFVHLSEGDYCAVLDAFVKVDEEQVLDFGDYLQGFEHFEDPRARGEDEGKADWALRLVLSMKGVGFAPFQDAAADSILPSAGSARAGPADWAQAGWRKASLRRAWH